MTRRFTGFVIAASVILVVGIFTALKVNDNVRKNNDIVSDENANECLSLRLLERNPRGLQWSASKSIQCETTLKQVVDSVPPTVQNARIFAANGELLWTIYRPVGGVEK